MSSNLVNKDRAHSILNQYYNSDFISHNFILNEGY